MYAEITDSVGANKLRAWFAARAQDWTINQQQPDDPDHSLDQPPIQPGQQESQPAERDTIQETIGNENGMQTVVQEVARADQVPSVGQAPGIPQARQAV